MDARIDIQMSRPKLQACARPPLVVNFRYWLSSVTMTWRLERRRHHGAGQKPGFMVWWFVVPALEPTSTIVAACCRHHILVMLSPEVSL
jgi:hypothetical protein